MKVGGPSFLILATETTNLRLVQELLRRGADVNYADSVITFVEHNKIVGQFVEIRSLNHFALLLHLRKSYQDEWNALLIAVKEDNIDIASELLDGGADIESKDCVIIMIIINCFDVDDLQRFQYSLCSTWSGWILSVDVGFVSRQNRHGATFAQTQCESQRLRTKSNQSADLGFRARLRRHCTGAASTRSQSGRGRQVWDDSVDLGRAQRTLRNRQTIVETQCERRCDRNGKVI